MPRIFFAYFLFFFFLRKKKVRESRRKEQKEERLQSVFTLSELLNKFKIPTLATDCYKTPSANPTVPDLLV